jgi:hypothetical protein
MSTSAPGEPIDVLLFRRNRDQFPEEQLEPYWGKHVAWRGDGTCIVASGDGDEDLVRRLNTLGIHPASVVIEFINDPNLSYF